MKRKGFTVGTLSSKLQHCVCRFVRLSKDEIMLNQHCDRIMQNPVNVCKIHVSKGKFSAKNITEAVSGSKAAHL